MEFTKEELSDIFKSGFDFRADMFNNQSNSEHIEAIWKDKENELKTNQVQDAVLLDVIKDIKGNVVSVGDLIRFKTWTPLENIDIRTVILRDGALCAGEVSLTLLSDARRGLEIINKS